MSIETQRGWKNFVDFEGQNIKFFLFAIGLYIHWGEESDIFLQTELFLKNEKAFSLYSVTQCTHEAGFIRHKKKCDVPLKFFYNIESMGPQECKN